MNFIFETIGNKNSSAQQLLSKNMPHLLRFMPTVTGWKSKKLIISL